MSRQLGLYSSCVVLSALVALITCQFIPKSRTSITPNDVPANTYISNYVNGVTVYMVDIPRTKIINNEWEIQITENTNRWGLRIDLDNTWTFDSFSPSAITMNLNGSSYQKSSGNPANLLLTVEIRGLNYYMSLVIDLDNNGSNIISPACDTNLTNPSASMVYGDAFNDMNNNDDPERFCNVMMVSNVCTYDDMVPSQIINTWPLQFTLKNYPNSGNGHSIIEYTSNNQIVQACAFNHEIKENTDIEFWLTATEKDDIIKISQIDLESFNIDASSQLTTLPSTNPSSMPSNIPSVAPSNNPTTPPSTIPSNQPSMTPSSDPSMIPSNNPSMVPSKNPSKAPSNHPSIAPSTTPSDIPSNNPSNAPSNNVSIAPSNNPTKIPSKHPSIAPSNHISTDISMTFNPTMESSRMPTNNPSTMATFTPSTPPTPTCLSILIDLSTADSLFNKMDFEGLYTLSDVWFFDRPSWNIPDVRSRNIRYIGGAWTINTVSKSLMFLTDANFPPINNNAKIWSYSDTLGLFAVRLTCIDSISPIFLTATLPSPASTTPMAQEIVTEFAIGSVNTDGVGISVIILVVIIICVVIIAITAAIYCIYKRSQYHQIPPEDPPHRVM